MSTNSLFYQIYFDKFFFNNTSHGMLMQPSNLNYLTILHDYHHRLNCQRCCAKHCKFWQPCLCNTTREVRTTTYFSCWMCIGNVRLWWINELNQTLSSLWSSSRRPSSETWSVCCTIVSPAVGLSLWSTCHATFYQPSVRMWMPIVLALKI